MHQHSTSLADHFHNSNYVKLIWGQDYWMVHDIPYECIYAVPLTISAVMYMYMYVGSLQSVSFRYCTEPYNIVTG